MHLRSHSNEMIVVFHASTNKEKARGLRLEYSFESKGCGGIFSGDSGVIFRTILQFCTLTFDSDEGKHLKLKLRFSGFKDEDRLLIYANTTNNGDVLLRR